MQHKLSEVNIYETSDYSIFTKIVGNRDLNATKIKKIKSDIDGGLNILRYCPILVSKTLDDKLEIIDGQHRFKVSQLVKSNVFYIIVDELTLVEIAKINSNQEKWKIKDFINCYCENGNENYIELRKFMLKYGFSLSVCLPILSGNTMIDGSSKNLLNDFESGKFIVESKELAYNLGDTILKFNKFKFYSQRTFIIAISKIVSKGMIRIEEVVLAFSKNSDKLERQITWKGYIMKLEEIVNIGKHKRVQIW